MMGKGGGGGGGGGGPGAEVWERAHDMFLASLDRLSAAATAAPPGDVSSLILPIHGSRLGNLPRSSPLEQQQQQQPPAVDATALQEFDSRAKREKALYDVNVALEALEEAFNKTATPASDDSKRALDVYRRIAQDLTIHTAPEQIQLYHSLLSVKPYDD